MGITKPRSSIIKRWISNTIVSYDDPYYDEFAKKRLLSKIRRIKGCWEWMGALDKDGYGIIRYRGETWRAHRLSWVLIGGKTITLGKVLNHLCRNRSCIYPGDLEEITNVENILCGNGFAAKNARKGYCKDGHEFSEDNIIWREGSRTCKKCYNEHHPNTKKYLIEKTTVKKEVLTPC